MKVLVIGATGYVGSRVIPELLDQGHTVIAGARSPEKLDAFWWTDQVTPASLDVSSDGDVLEVLSEHRPDALVYLVHGMTSEDFREKDLEAARRVRDAVSGSSIRCIVYVTGIIPDVSRDALSEHLISRLEVEEVLSQSEARCVSLRAAIILGAGSTSFELMNQLAQRLPVTVFPNWMNHQVQPVAVTDVARAVHGALSSPEAQGDYDIAGTEPIAYPELVDRVLTASGNERPSLSTGLLPQALVSKAASLISDVPGPTVKALMESLREDMVARDDRWLHALLPDGSAPPLGIDAVLTRALADTDTDSPANMRDPLGLLPGDPNWATGSL